jgi:drug/metabolite transporter (DMT)-like permease
MMWMTYVVALLCVLGLVIGQLLFKYGASAWHAAGSWINGKVLLSVLSAMVLYATTSIVWVWVLKRIELGRIYPLMALAFLLVPVGSYFLFGERFNAPYYVGVCLIVIGVSLTAGSSL